MALQDTKPSKDRKGQPLTENPLFPAVVALWFGALFGLGSLAIRVGLLEQLILASKLDTVFSAAAPPLGVTARILLALVLAALGAALGAWIARKIAAPKPMVRERKRGAAPAAEVGPVEFRARDSHPDAPARRPISAHEELGGAQSPTAGALAGRRRSVLAIEHDETFELHENAPLPGGAWQIHAADAAPDDDALDLGSFADGDSEETATDAFAPLPPAPGPRLDWQADGTATTDRQLFQPLPSAAPDAPRAAPDAPGAAPVIEEVAPEASATAPLDFAPPADAPEGRQVFGMAQPQPDEVLDQLGITDAEFEELAPVTLPVEPPAADTAVPVAAPESAPVDNAKLGIDDLAAKLAASMAARRERAAAKAAAAAAALAQPAPTEPAAEDAAPAIPTACQPPVAAAPDATLSAAAPLPETGFFHPNDIPAPSLADLPPMALPPLPQVLAAPAQPTAFAVPSETPAPAEAPSVMSTRVPAALRPIALGIESDDEDEAFANLLPARSIAMPAPVAAVAEPASEPVAVSLGDEDHSDEPANESRFSSLLEVVQPIAPRQDFIRIEEPTDPSLDIEPVVIFPGHAARLNAVDTQDSDEFGSFRRFDAPGSAEHGQAVAASPVPAADAAETEKALRAALANLQRMSGAA